MTTIKITAGTYEQCAFLTMAALSTDNNLTVLKSVRRKLIFFGYYSVLISKSAFCDTCKRRKP